MSLSKNTIIAILAVIIVVVAGIGIVVANGSLVDDVVGVTYDGNSGVTSNGDKTTILSNETAVECLFAYEGYMFVNWNTKSDGSGTTYNVGDPVSNGMTLFAQWKAKPHTISYSFISSLSTGISFTINNSPLTPMSTFYSPAIIQINGGSNWIYNDDHTFTGTVEGKLYNVSIIITGYTEGSLIAEVNESDTPTIGFKTTQNVGISIHVRNAA